MNVDNQIYSELGFQNDNVSQIDRIEASTKINLKDLLKKITQNYHI